MGKWKWKEKGRESRCVLEVLIVGERTGVGEIINRHTRNREGEGEVGGSEE